MSRDVHSRCSCSPADDDAKDGDNETLQIMERFRSFYEGKLKDIEKEGGGECLELKIKVQEKWIQDLTEQTEMMAKIVKELEVEATARVQMLEEKLKQSSKTAYEKAFYLENDVKNLVEFVRRVREDGRWSIDGLQFYEVAYNDLFGKENNNIKIVDSLPADFSHINEKEIKQENEERIARLTEEMACVNEQLKAKSDECENLRQSMIDMRSALTEEVACKHDMISSLRKDIQQLEERCVQSDKQTAFKDDIIKELRKEIKLLKQQEQDEREEMSNRIEELEAQLETANKKISAHDENHKLVNNKSKLIRNKDETIQIQTNTLNVIQTELQESRKKDSELNKRNEEICQLKCICTDLETELEDTRGRADNLQKAVDLYLNSINVLEASEEKHKLELEQQRTTINNLQEALVSAKGELDELREKGQQEAQNHEFLANILCVNIADLEKQNGKLQEEVSECWRQFKHLQECNFELEIEHFNALQDLALFETQLYKYQSEFKQYEGSKMVARSELKKLRQQKRCYEHVVDCFKQEMTVMSEQLVHLQEILNLSNKSSKEESSQLHNTLADLQELNERLKRELIETEQKVLVENHMNQIKDAQIGELQQIIGQKNVDLNMHDEAIHEMKLRLENCTIENHELQGKVVALQSTVAQLQLALQSKEGERSFRVETHESALFVCQKGLSDVKEDLQMKTQKLMQIEADYRVQAEMLQAAQKELDRVKEKTREKCKCFKAANESLQEKLAKYEAHNRQLKEDLTRIKNKTTDLAQRECCREQELSQYKQIVIELRQTLIEINENLAVAQLDHLAFDENIAPTKGSSQAGDIYSTCRCEINLYKKLVENFKVALIQATQKVVDLGGQNNKLNEELKQNDIKIAEMQRKLSKKEKETCEHVKELVEKLEESKAEEKRLTDFVDKLRIEIQKKIDEHINIKAQEEDVAATQEEITSLKGEIKKMIQNQYSLNAENDKLLSQITRLQGIIGPLEEANRIFREKLDKALAEILYLKEVNRNVLLEKDKLTNELQALHANYNKLEKAHQCVKESARNLEMELADTRNIRDDICVESRHVVNNVKAWLEEQRKINEQVKRKAQGYCEAMEKLKRENEMRLSQSQNPNQDKRTCLTGAPCNAAPKSRKNVGFRANSPPPPEYNWRLGSQGTGSLNDRDSPRGSPSSFLTCSVEEWYSPNYRDEDDTDYNDDGFVERIEALTVQMRESNKKWKTTERCHDCDKK